MPAFPAAQQRALDAGTATVGSKAPEAKRRAIIGKRGGVTLQTVKPVVEPDYRDTSHIYVPVKEEPMPKKGYVMTEEHKANLQASRQARAKERAAEAGWEPKKRGRRKGFKLSDEHKAKIRAGRNRKRDISSAAIAGITPSTIDQTIAQFHTLIQEAHDDGFRKGWVAAFDHGVELFKRQALQPAKPKA